MAAKVVAFIVATIEMWLLLEGVPVFSRSRIDGLRICGSPDMHAELKF